MLRDEETSTSTLSVLWRCGSVTVDLTRPVVMGILNVTPDSFSDGGTHNGFSASIDFAMRMLDDGATIIDVGGESTRPGSDEVSIEEELSRVLPVVKELVSRKVIVSVDTRHADVAAACVEVGAAIINDVSGFRDPRMVEVAAGCDAGLVVMHMAGEPKTMQATPQYDDVVGEVAGYLVDQARLLEKAGVASERICIDPGPGFGKTTAHNLELIAGSEVLASLGYPLMVAVSRKRFLGEVTGTEVPRERVAESVACALMACERGARIARVHDVASTVAALCVLDAIEGAER